MIHEGDGVLRCQDMALPGSDLGRAAQEQCSSRLAEQRRCCQLSVGARETDLSGRGQTLLASATLVFSEHGTPRCRDTDDVPSPRAAPAGTHAAELPSSPTTQDWFYRKV